MSTGFDDWVDREGLEQGQEARLRRVHELLLEAGPPPDLPAALEHPPPSGEARVLRFPRPARRAVALIGVAAALAAALAGGYALGHRGGGGDVVKVVTLQGRTSFASLRVWSPDAAGNWPLELRVTGLPKLRSSDEYYELMLTRGGKPEWPCGGFRVYDRDRATLRFTVPYKVTRSSNWVVMIVSRKPGQRAVRGPIVMRPTTRSAGTRLADGWREVVR